MTNYIGKITHRLQDLLNNLTSHSPIQQAIIAVESGDQSFRWIGSTSKKSANGAQVRADTPFFIASIDKLFNATVIMKLMESCRLNLDASITNYLPLGLTHGIHQLGGIDYSDQITIRHLLGHTSGLADWLEDRPRGGRSLVERVISEGDLILSIEDMVTILRDHLKPHFPPQDISVKRQKARYSDTNYMLLIAIIEAIMGQPLHTVHEQLLFKPLDLRHTYFMGYSNPLDSTPEPMILRSGGNPIYIPLMMRTIRGIYSTATDMVAFLRQFMRGEVFQHPETLRLMQERWNQFGFPLDRAAFRAPSWPVEYGLGIMRFRLPRTFSPKFSMPPVLGHTGSTGCWLFYCPYWDLLSTGSVDEVTAGAVPYRIIPKILNILRSSDYRPSAV